MRIKCRKCGIEKDATTDNFYWRKDSGTFRKTCILCVIKHVSKYTSANKSKVDERLAGYRERNREKLRLNAEKYNSKPETKINMRKYRIINRKKLRKKEKEWREKNPDKHKEIAKRKSAKQAKKPMRRLRTNVSRSISLRLKRVGVYKGGKSSFDFLPFTLDELRKHLESQFEPWMNWGNYGVYKVSTWKDNDITSWKWQVDHIKPHSEFPYISMEDENFKKCWSLSNLRPLSAKQNILDGSYRNRHAN